MNFHSFTDWLAVGVFVGPIVFGVAYLILLPLAYLVRRISEAIKTPPVVKRIRKYSRRRFDLR